MDLYKSFGGVYGGRRVLVTGHTGFKGGWLSLWLRELGAEVYGLALPAPEGPGLYGLICRNTFAGESTVNVCDAAALEAALARIRPEFIFHLAAQSLVRRSYAVPMETVEVNVNGTLHLLDAVRRLGLAAQVLVVTTDKCYENRNWDHGYRESDPLGGHDVYSASKAACEVLVAAWRRSFFEPDRRLGRVATARGGNVVGGGDFSADRIVPDCIRSLSQRKSIQVRHPRATRPWQHVLDCLGGYLGYAAALSRPEGSDLPGALNFGPLACDHRDVRSLVEELLRHWPGTWVDASDPQAPHEASRLQLSTDLASARLGWHPTWGFGETMARTAEWYRRFHDRGGTGMRAFSVRQIAAYVAAAQKAGQSWAGVAKPR